MAAEDPNHPNPYMFTGRRFDIEIGLYYYRAKQYIGVMGGKMAKGVCGCSIAVIWVASEHAYVGTAG